MEILVCIKQVPGSSNVDVDPVTGVLLRNGFDVKMNPYDLYALELALTLTEKYGGSVKVISMGPPAAIEVINEAIQMGAVYGCLISDRKFAGADVLATAYTLSQGITKMGNFDLILCGKQTTDGDTAQVGSELAEFLNIVHMANIIDVPKVEKDKITVVAKQENRLITQTMPLPCVLCTDGDINTPRLPSYKRKKELEGKTDNVGIISFADFEDKDEKKYGLAGSPTQVERIFPPQKNTEKQMITGDCIEVSDKLFDILKSRKFI